MKVPLQVEDRIFTPFPQILQVGQDFLKLDWACILNCNGPRTECVGHCSDFTSQDILSSQYFFPPHNFSQYTGELIYLLNLPFTVEVVKEFGDGD